MQTRISTVGCAWLIVCAAGACSGSAGPTPLQVGLGLQPGPHWLRVTGYDLSSDPNLPVCTPFGLPTPHKLVTASVVLRRDGAEWVAQSEPGLPGDIEVTFRETVLSAIIEVEGSVRGTAVDTTDMFHTATGVRVSFEGSQGARATGKGSRVSPFVNGRFDGALTFRNDKGEVASCQAVTWTLGPK